jgi:UDP-3-O-[3-hydroxymyristoyl] glucosamine N-acyltransferase
VSRTASRRTLRELFDDRFRNRWLSMVLHAELTPPPPEAFGAFGRSIIVPPARVNLPRSIFIGDGVVIHESVWLSVVQSHTDIVPRLEIHDGVRVGRFCQISCVGEIVIERDVITSDRVQIGDTYHDYRDVNLPATRQPMARPRPVRIGAGSLLGSGVIVLPGTTVGPGAYLVDGAVVSGVVPAGAVMAGNPAIRVEDILGGVYGGTGNAANPALP